jgi:hypothetical protein
MVKQPSTLPETPSVRDHAPRAKRALNLGGQASRRETRLAVLRAELEVERDELRRIDDGSSRIDHYDRALEMLAEAENALERNDPISSRWASFSAQKMAVLGLVDVDGSTDQQGGRGDPDPGARYRQVLRRKKALELYVSASEQLSGRRKERFDDLLTTDGELNEEVDAIELAAAIRVFQEYYFAHDLIFRKLKRQLSYFVAFAALTLVVLLASALGNVFGPVLGEASDVVKNQFLVYVVLFGVLGASMHAIFSISRRFVRGKIIETTELVDLPMVIARVVAGGVSALALFVVLQSGVFAFQFGAGLALSLALAAGYSEEVVRNALESVSGRIVDQSREAENESVTK